MTSCRAPRCAPSSSSAWPTPRARPTSSRSAATPSSRCRASRRLRADAMRVGVAALWLAVLISVLPVTSGAQTAVEYYWWKAAERAEGGDLAGAREDLQRAAGYATDPDTAFAIQGKLVDVDTALAFREYARSLRESTQVSEAAAVEEHATRYARASFGGGDGYLGFNPAEVLTLYDEAVALLGQGGCPAAPDFAAAQRGRETALRQRDRVA